MELLVREFKPEAYNTYYDRPDLLEPIFDLLLSEPNRLYAMRIVSAKTGVRTTTLYSSDERIRADPTWRPSRDRFSESRRIFPDEIEQTSAQFIRVNFLAQERRLDCPRLQPPIHILVHDFVAWHILPASALNFKCSYHFMSRFLDRANLSFRKTHPTKLPTIDDEACANFPVQLAAVQLECPAERSPNLDESSWRLTMASEKSIAERGAEIIPRFTGADSKACFAFFGTCVADGSKCPLILLAKGKTDRCRKQFGSVGPPYELWHSPSG
jgi:hypothetical protein